MVDDVQNWLVDVCGMIISCLVRERQTGDTVGMHVGKGLLQTTLNTNSALSRFNDEHLAVPAPVANLDAGAIKPILTYALSLTREERKLDTLFGSCTI